ncbi:hypothetical protein C8B47_03665 [filamentous cyanobacterium CCP4]|nr:hypothetical protein C8B47_03665 [filamentous cyanobacterium CCP4]
MLAESQATSTYYDYLNLEMTVIPIPNGQKHPAYRWKRLQWSKLHKLLDNPKHLPTLSAFYRLGGEGLAVICGRPSENLFVIDCDTMEALAHVKQQLWIRQISAPCVFSARGGHIYLRCREGAVKGIASGVIEDIEIKGDGELAVLPPTIHHTGIRYQWQHGIPRHIPTISTDEIDFLTDIDGKPVELKTTGNSQRRLHDDTRRYLQHGQSLAKGHRNNALYKASRDYAYVGKHRTAAYHDLLPIARSSGLDDAEISATIDSAYGNTPTHVASNSITDQLLAFRDNASWQGRTGNTDKRVLTALIERRKQDAYTRTDGQFRASYRELMQLSGIRGWRTIKHSIERLTSTGYIEAMGVDKASSASLYRFSDMVISAGAYFSVHKVHTNTAVAVRSTYCLSYAHPLSKSIGTTATDILNHLHANGAQSIKQIASAIDKHRTTATRHLAKLQSHNLVCKDDNLYCICPITTSDEISIIRDTGAYATQHELEERHDRERALFALNPILAYLYEKNNKQEATSCK